MMITITSLDLFLVITSIVLVSTYYIVRNQSHRALLDAPYRIYLTLLLVAHIMYITYAALIFWPPNLFSQLEIPLNVPPNAIRAELYQRFGLPADAILPTLLEMLLTRLSTAEMRSFYVRFGEAVMQECEHCHTFDEYACFALPRALIEYIRCAFMLGTLTITGSGRERWRTHAIGVLVAAAIAEGYWILTAPVDMVTEGQDVVMLHDNLWLLRQALFLFLPIATHLLPATQFTPSPTAGLIAARIALEQSMARLATLRYMRGAVMRHPTLRAAAGEWWDHQRVEGEWAREDENVRRVADQLGLGFAEGNKSEGLPQGKMRTAAQKALVNLKHGLIPVPQ